MESGPVDILKNVDHVKVDGYDLTNSASGSDLDYTSDVVNVILPMVSSIETVSLRLIMR